MHFRNTLRDRLEASQTVGMHPSAEVLTAFVERTARPDERDRVLHHLASCPVCRQTVAIALPELTTESLAVKPRNYAARLPLAMRWASLAAALTVAIGVGVIAYEHQASPGGENAAKAQVPTASGPSVTTKTEAPPPPLIAKQSAKEERKSVASIARTRVSASSKKLQSQNAEVALSGGVIGGLVGGKASKRQHVEVAQGNSGIGFGAGYGGGVFRPSPPNAPASSQKAQSDSSAYHGATAFNSAEMAKAEAQSADVSPSQYEARAKPTNAVAGAAAGGRISLEKSLSPKVASPAMAGPAMKARSINQPAAIALWTITAEGKLQRHSLNGTLTTIEPAANLAIRTVAAEGIEVWAAGSRFNSEATSQTSMLFHSSDAGETWVQVVGPWKRAITAIKIASPKIEVIAADGAWTTVDAGDHWVKQ